MDPLLAAIAVSMLPVSRGRAAAVFHSRRELSDTVRPSAVLEAFGIVGEEASRLEEEALAAAGAALAAGARAGILALGTHDARYPPLLGFIPDPPPVLWVRGDPAVLQRPAVAVVGSRAASSYALDVGARLAAELAARDVVVVSGLARGVDSAAHRGTLGAGGATVAVLGSGVDRIYPSEHRSLAVSIEKDGAVVSELGPGAPPLPEHFPLRNRIISGISLAVVVVEAGEKSGSLITVRCALEQGRDVMAVPGSVLSGRNRGSHGLLKDGAKVVETAEDILDGLLPLTAGPPGAAGGGGTRQPERDSLLSRMEPGEAYRLDQLVGLTGQPPGRLLARLTELELAGRVAAAGGRYSRILTPP